ncbi:MAG: FAD-dependent thymidylate synthase [Vicinamibacteria bacterium]
MTLRAARPRAYDGAIAAARTCYSPRVIGDTEVTEKQRDTIGPLTFTAGHHTVFQHATFEFGLENVSRHFVWAFLHSHPFYNSEQSSQRFVKLGEAKAYVPDSLSPEARAVYEDSIEKGWAAYARLSQILVKDTTEIIGDIRHLSPTASEARRKKVDREASKKSIEVARYVIPIAAFTSMVHSLSGLVLHRLYRMSRSSDTPTEASLVIGEMVRLAREHDPAFFEKVGEQPFNDDQIVESRWARSARAAASIAADIDARLGARTSLLVDHSANAEQVTADAMRSVLGVERSALSDDEAIEQALSPGLNSYRLDALDLAPYSPISRVSHHANYTFLKKLSHTADSQDQRHRMTPASRPMLTLTHTTQPDVVIPPLIAANTEARAVFEDAVAHAWRAKETLLAMGVPDEVAVYVLPNATALRFHESGSLMYLAHKWVMRTCLNAQEEIYRASMDELEQVRAIHPRLARHMGPPCVLRRNRITPTCTEGEHFCGIPVWRDFPNITRRL